MGIDFDGATRRILLTAGTTAVGVRELWSRWADWHAQADNARFLPAFRQVGGDDIDAGAGTAIPIYAFLINGWRIRPQPANHTLRVGDGVLLVDGGGDPFVDPDGVFMVRINYQQPVQAITVATSGGAAATPAQIADAVWQHATGISVADRLAIAAVILRNKSVTDPASGVMTIYADDGATPLLTAQLYENAGGTQPYRGQGAERRERLQ